MRKLVPALAAAVIIGACTSSQGFVPSKFSALDKAVMESAFVYGLKDPSAVQTQDVRVFQAPNGNRIICGQANAKNSFGGYIGYQTFAIMKAGAVDYSSPYARPIFTIGGVSAIDCGGAGYTPSV
jgi:hypothetical protein